MTIKKYKTDELISDIPNLEFGQCFLLSGIIYTARDAAHKRIIETLEKNKKLPFKLKNSAIYYCGPSPARPGQIIGACGPTTSSRMDIWTPKLLEEGVKILIGKGRRSDYVMKALKKNKSIYLSATGGIAALLSKTVKRAQVIGFEDLGTESVHELEVENMPLMVAM